jgi:heme a synthase
MLPRNPPASPRTSPNPWPHRLAWALVIVVFPLIWMGGTVTTCEAGMAVPDWPTTYSYWFYPVKLWLAVWDVFLEHGHRLLAQLAGILAILLAAALWRLDDRRWMRWIGLALLVGVILQGVLGGLRVLVDDRVLARIHGCTAPLYFGLCAAAVAWTSRAWRQSPASAKNPSLRDDRGFGPPRLAWLVTLALYVEIVLGALLRRPATNAALAGAELWTWLKTLSAGQIATWFEACVWLKVINAGLIAVGVAWLVIGASRQRLARRAWLLATLLLVQLALAAVAWAANYGWPAWFTGTIWPVQYTVVAQGRLQVLCTTAHAAIGSLTLVASLSLSLWLQSPLARFGREAGGEGPRP